MEKFTYAFRFLNNIWERPNLFRRFWSIRRWRPRSIGWWRAWPIRRRRAWSIGWWRPGSIRWWRSRSIIFWWPKFWYISSIFNTCPPCMIEWSKPLWLVCSKHNYFVKSRSRWSYPTVTAANSITTRSLNKICAAWDRRATLFTAWSKKKRWITKCTALCSFGY